MARTFVTKNQLLAAALIAVLLTVLGGSRSALAARTCTVRYYVSPMVGSGTEADPLRPLVLDLPSYPHRTFATDWLIIYDGTRHPYALVTVASPNHKPLLKNEELGVLPDIPLDTSIYDFTPEEADMISNTLLMFDMDFEAILDEAETYGEILLQMARYIDPFNGVGIPTLETCPLK